MNQPLTSARVAAVLAERISAFNIDRNLSSGLDGDSNHKSDARRGRSTSPIRANVRRRRSVASAPGDILGRQLSRQNNLILLPDGNNVSFHSRAEFQSQFQETVTLRRKEVAQESSTKRRLSHTDDIERRKRKKTDENNKVPNKPAIEKSESIKASLKGIKGSERLIVPPLPLSGCVEDDDGGDEETYERKGVFRLKRDKGVDEFRLPKPLSHPEPLWRAGDGFSVNEARPNFAFLMTGTHKQRKPRSTPGVGELQLETCDGNEEDPRRSGVSRRKSQRLHRYEMKHRRGAVKDVWPTIENFSEELEIRKRKPTVPANEMTIPSTIRPQPTPVPQARETLRYNQFPIRTRRNSDFENFGRHIGNGDIISNARIADTHINLTHHVTQSGSVSEESLSDEEQPEVEGEEEEYINKK